MPTGQEIRMDEAFVESQGGMVTLLNKDRARATWYRPDGKAIPNLPTDMYHRTLYRAKGWTLLNPKPLVRDPVEGVLVRMKPSESEEGTIATEEKIVAPPPRHIHVMQAAIGSQCLVQGCSHVRKAELVGIKKTVHRTKRAVKETSNA